MRQKSVARCFYYGRGIAHLNTGVAGQKIFIFRGAPLRLRRSNPFLAGPSRRAEGKGHAVRRGSEHSVANPSNSRLRGGFVWRERNIDIPSPLSPPFGKGRGFLSGPASATPFESLFGRAPAASARERARGATRQRSIAWPIPLIQGCGEASLWRKREVLTFPPLCPLPLAKGGAFYLKPRFGCAVRITLWQGPRGERKGKGTRCDAAASIAWPISRVIAAAWPVKIFYSSFTTIS